MDRAALEAYRAALAPVSADTARTSLSKVRGYLAWLALAELDGDPLSERRARDWAVLDYGSSIRPQIRQLDPTDPAARGRGMRLVERIAHRWGSEDHHGGKRVWFELDTATPALLDDANPLDGHG